ncbi:MAG: hypothetical protein Q8M09_20035 [Pseudomonadota bacterium]|nr:hypothetical protein [Pseudomonadota bacterium]MDP1906506.1 hypothetical protein [Pseudomonadota bacterium]MDP2351197.1 hypothetical protein [Pseudomonadota bacterium]
MEAMRLFAEPINHQLVIDLPPSLERCRLEIIVMPAASADQNMVTVLPRRRKPSPLLAGTVQLKDNLIDPAVSETDWDAVK